MITKFINLARITEPRRKKNEATADQKSQESSLQKSSAGTQRVDSRLESLPPEVRRHLLSTLDLPQLKVLVRASATFHRQYLYDRRYLLCRSLEETLGPVTVDAYAVYLSQTQSKDPKRNVSGFLESAYALKPPLPLTLDETLGMAGFYFRSVKPVADYYTRRILKDLAKEAGRGAQTNGRKSPAWKRCD